MSKTFNQKFFRGTRVQVAKDLGPGMAHFQAGVAAIVIGSYNDTCGLGGHSYSERDSRSYDLLLLNAEGEPDRSVAWYLEDQLTLLNSDRDAGEALLQQYIYTRAR